MWRELVGLTTLWHVAHALAKNGASISLLTNSSPEREILTNGSERMGGMFWQTLHVVTASRGLFPEEDDELPVCISNSSGWMEGWPMSTQKIIPFCLA